MTLKHKAVFVFSICAIILAICTTINLGIQLWKFFNDPTKQEVTSVVSNVEHIVERHHGRYARYTVQRYNTIETFRTNDGLQTYNGTYTEEVKEGDTISHIIYKNKDNVWYVSDDDSSDIKNNIMSAIVIIALGLFGIMYSFGDWK
jgi:hypothetical protein